MNRLVIIALLIVLAVPALAQAPAGPPKPGPEHQKLDYFVGTWTSTGDMKPSPFGPGGKFTFTERNEWFPGGFFLVTHSEGEMPAMGKVKGLATMGYDPEKKMYTYHAVDNMGMQESATGQVDGDTWNWTSEGAFGGKVYKHRYTMKQESPTQYAFKFEQSEDGMNWNTIMEGTAKKAAGKTAAKTGTGAKKAPAKGAASETTTTTTTKTTTKKK